MRKVRDTRERVKKSGVGSIVPIPSEPGDSVATEMEATEKVGEVGGAVWWAIGCHSSFLSYMMVPPTKSHKTFPHGASEKHPAHGSSEQESGESPCRVPRPRGDGLNCVGVYHLSCQEEELPGEPATRTRFQDSASSHICIRCRPILVP